jgi:nitroreductase
MEFHEVIEKRRTIRIFKLGVTEAQLRKLLAAGAKAPSTRNKQSWEFIHVTDQQRVDQIAELKYQYNRKFPPGPGESQQEVEERALNQKRWFAHASVVAVCTQGGDAASAWLAVENISLAAIADGLGSGIIGFGGDEKKAVEKLLGLPAGYELVCVLKVGVPEGPVTKPPMRPEFSWLHTDTF